MPSPFPGMNPYLEHPAVWVDFHQTFIPAAREALTPQVRPRYFVRVQEQIYLRDADERALVGSSDVDLGLTGRGSPPTGTSAAVTAAPVRGVLPDLDPLRLAYLEVVTTTDHRLVTVIELLSPANKTPGPDREKYLRKRRRLLNAGINYVEIDLLRGGRRPPVDGRPECDYCVMVSRPADRPNVDLWPVRLREPLPPIPVPLEPAHPDARLDLQSLLHRVYDGAGYEDTVYAQPPVPRLTPADAAWAADVLRAAGRPDR
ncbi:MAG: DUF4058 family protein [Gemmataceae bacterium]